VIGRLLDLGDPSSAQASSAASSTSNQRASLPSSDQIRRISGRA
jgi:hypothetical protein